jgi:hypothetical protein
LGFLKLLYGEDYISLSARQSRDIYELGNIDGVSCQSHFRELHPGSQAHKVHVSYRESYCCVIGGDVFRTLKKQGEEAEWLDSRLRHIFEHEKQ